MVQKIHPRGVIWGAFFPPPVEIVSSVLSIYIVVLGLAYCPNIYTVKTGRSGRLGHDHGKSWCKIFSTQLL